MRGTYIPDFHITGISAGGIAFGIHGELTVFVDKAIPGDVADIVMIKSSRDEMLAGGKIVALKKNSPLRIDSFCKHFNYCGGCQWQNISYGDQLKFKQQQVERLFEGFERFNMFDIVPSENQTRFRNRVTFTFSNRRWMSPEELKDSELLKRPAAGYALKGKNDRIMNIEECFLSDDFAVQMMHALRDEVLAKGYSFYDARHEKGFLRAATIRFGDENGIMVIVVFGEGDEEKIKAVMDYLKESFPKITSLYYVIHKKKRGVAADKPHIHFSGKTFIEYRMEDLTFRIGPNSFYQTNSRQAYQLYKTAREFAQLTGAETVYDLYTGTGTIALFVSSQSKKVIGIDNTPEAIEDAKQNVKRNNISNTTFLAGDLKNTLTEELFGEYGKPDVIITDPPRAGMPREVNRVLAESGAQRIVYISCNPVTQARDIRNMSSHYRLVKSQPVDMFPQTSHVENVALLERI